MRTQGPDGRVTKPLRRSGSTAEWGTAEMDDTLSRQQWCCEERKYQRRKGSKVGRGADDRGELAIMKRKSKTGSWEKIRERGPR